MSNNLTENAPGYSGEHSLETSNDDNPEELEIPTPEVPYVSVYGMKGARNIYHDTFLRRGTLFNLKTEPVEDREIRYQETNRAFLQRCRDPNEICAYTQYLQSNKAKANIGIKSEPIDDIEDDIEDDTSSVYMETEPFDYLPEVYSESTENSSQINAFNPRENELENNRIQREPSREPEEEIDQQDNIPIVELLVLTGPQEPEHIDETIMQLVVPEATVLLNTTTETPSSTDTTTNPRASDLDSANTNIIENPSNTQRKTRKNKVFRAPTRVSTRIKKPRIMYNV